jgi:hypothetical protein
VTPDEYCEDCGRFHPRYIRCAPSESVSWWWVLIGALAALFVSYLVGYWTAHSTPPGSM